jgi:DNA modification methylase
MKPKAVTQYRKLSELKELPGNPRTIKKDQFEKLKTSLQNNADYFEARPIILSDRTGELVIIAGNQRYKAAKAIGLTEVPTILLSGLSEEREREIVIRDNVENGDWDMDALANEWNAQDLLDWGVELPELEAMTEVVEDTPPEVNEEEPPMTKLGQIWQLGEHRLMVGDSTSEAQVAALMDGKKADLLVTDPPYGVDYGNYKDADEAKRLKRRTDGLTVANDAFEDDSGLVKFLTSANQVADANLKDGGAFYIWHASSKSKSFQDACAAMGWQTRQTLIWAKDRLSLGRQDYQWQHEPCLYGWKGGAGHYFRDVRTETTVFDDEKPIDELSNKELKELVRNYRQVLPTSIIRENKPSKSEEHPTMKPVKLIARLVANSSRERERVLDIFGGSGTTMIACEQLGRSCYMMELDPHYADVIIERWQNFTGQTAKLIKEV